MRAPKAVRAAPGGDDIQLVIGPARQIQFVKSIALDKRVLRLKSRFPLLVASLLALVFANRNDARVFVSKEKLASLMDGDAKSAFRAIGSLEELGYLWDTGARRGRARVYEMRIPNRAPVPENDEINSGMGARNDEKSRTRMSSTSGMGVPEIGHGCPAYIEPTSEPAFEPNAHADFDVFSKAWATGDRSDPVAQAQPHWEALSTADKVAALSAIGPYLADCTAHGRKVCHARNWISEKRWVGFVPEPQELAPLNKLVVYRDTNEGRAWDDHFRKTKGKSPPWKHSSSSDKQYWMFDTAWPPT